MTAGVYVVVPKHLLPDLEELDIVVAGPTRGVAADVLVSIGVAGGLIGAAADTVTVLMGRSEVARLARRLGTVGRRRDETTKIVLDVRQGADQVHISFEMSGPGTEPASEVFVRSFVAAFSTMFEERDDDR
jgi:hypothetical protein